MSIEQAKKVFFAPLSDEIKAELAELNKISQQLRELPTCDYVFGMPPKDSEQEAQREEAVREHRAALDAELAKNLNTTSPEDECLHPDAQRAHDAFTATSMRVDGELADLDMATRLRIVEELNR